MFEKTKELYKLQKEARRIKSELKNIHIEAETEGVIVTINGEQEVVKVAIGDEAFAKAVAGKKADLESALEKSFNKAVKKSQQIGAEKMKDIMGDMNFPGLSGGDK